MQLPPTILSTDRAKKESKKSKAETKSVGNVAKESADGKSSQKQSAKDHSGENSETQSSESDAPPDKGTSGTDRDKAGPVTASRGGKRRALRPPRSLETTMFERLEKIHGSGIKRMLTIQYR